MGIIHRSFTGTGKEFWGTERVHCTHCTQGQSPSQSPQGGWGLWVGPEWGVAFSAILWHKMRNWQMRFGITVLWPPRPEFQGGC